jgi:uncharacterized OsmC-like protein
MSEQNQFIVTLKQINQYEFNVKFSTGAPDLITDEPPPLGHLKGPHPAALIATGVANCLSASLYFCLNKYRVPSQNLEAKAITTMTRNERGRLRIGKIEIEINVQYPDTEKEKFQKCLEIFEDFCVVTESVKNGIPVEVKVNDVNLNQTLHQR